MRRARIREPKYAVIPGGTGGIGSAVVKMFLEHKTKVVVPSRSGKNSNLPDDQNLSLRKCNYYRDRAVRRLIESLGNIDTLVYCAGSFKGHKRVSDFSDKDIEDKFQTNIRSLWHFLRYVIPIMRERRYGNIIAIGSLAAEQRKPYLGLSTWAKVGTEAIIETLANEESANGIKANIIVPSIVDSPKERGIFPNDDRSLWIPPSEIAEMVEFLCFNPASSRLHGTRLRVYVPDPNKLKSREDELKERGAIE